MSKNFVLVGAAGKTFKGSNLKDFCKKHDLNSSSMSKVCRGLISNHHGWTGYYV